jgi:mannosyl-oligosaccharide alpha-1,2-mannosidase
MYLDSANKAIEKLLYKPMTMEERDILMTGELVSTPNHSTPAHQREYIEKFRPEVAHLACFAGGMFAMGGVLFNKPEHVEIGAKLTDGCVWAYNATATGIMPEGAELMMCPDTWGKCPWNETAYWEVLDPYQKSRLNPPKPVGQPPAGSSGDSGDSSDGSYDNDFAPPSKVVSEAEIGPQLPKPDDDDTSNLAKRQLDSANPPPPSPARAPLPVGSLTSSPVENIDPFYTPEPPLSHAAYVAAKIAEERLPPGYTKINFRSYILRPEAIESVFYLYRITGDKYWRDVGWDMFTSIDRHTKAMHGNSAIDDVTKSAPEQLDQMESFWVAETLKYFYLLYDEPGRWSLDEWVLNTEAHLFRRPEGEFLPEKFS